MGVPKTRDCLLLIISQRLNQARSSNCFFKDETQVDRNWRGVDSEKYDCDSKNVAILKSETGHNNHYRSFLDPMETRVGMLLMSLRGN